MIFKGNSKTPNEIPNIDTRGFINVRITDKEKNITLIMYNFLFEHK